MGAQALKREFCAFFKFCFSFQSQTPISPLYDGVRFLISSASLSIAIAIRSVCSTCFFMQSIYVACVPRCLCIKITQTTISASNGNQLRNTEKNDCSNKVSSIQVSNFRFIFVAEGKGVVFTAFILPTQEIGGHITYFCQPNKAEKAAQSASADRNGPYHSLLLKFNIMHPPGKASSHLNINCFFTYSTTAREVKTKAALSGKV